MITLQFVEPSVELIQQDFSSNNKKDLEKGIYKIIELVGRVSYRSEDKITDDSCIAFVERMMKLKHLSTCEFGTVYLTIPSYGYNGAVELLLENPFSRGYVYDDYIYITTNLRVIIENDVQELMRYITPPTKTHPKRYVFRVNTSIGVSREANRHRANSVLEMSTRYVNFDKKFGSFPVVIPSFLNKEFIINDTNPGGFLEDYAKECYWLTSVQQSFESYSDLINLGCTPQEARGVLPLDTATTYYHCAFEDDWKHFIELRSAKNAHPEIRIISDKVKEILDSIKHTS